MSGENSSYLGSFWKSWCSQHLLNSQGVCSYNGTISSLILGIYGFYFYLLNQPWIFKYLTKNYVHTDSVHFPCHCSKTILCNDRLCSL